MSVEAFSGTPMEVLEGSVVVAHRGVSSRRPENTLSAMRLAIDLRVPAIEFDVRRTRDGELVLMHDETVDRTTNGSGRVSDLTVAQLRALDAGEGQPVPTLGDVVREVRGRAVLFVEMKVRGLWDDALDLVQDGGSPQEVVVISFLESEIAEMKAARPEVPGGVLVRGSPAAALDATKRANADIVGLWADAVGPEFVASAHRAGRRVLTWTVDHPVRASELAAIGVDYIASNAPDRILDAVRGVRREPGRRPRGGP